MEADPFDIWTAPARAFRPLLEQMLCRNGATAYATHPENMRVGFGWPMGTSKHHILALGEDQHLQNRLLVRLTVGPNHDLIKPGSPFFTPSTGKKKDIEERVDCLILYGKGFPEGFLEAVEKSFEYLLRDPELVQFRDPVALPTIPIKAFDTSEPPQRIPYVNKRIVRDTAMAIEVKKVCKYRCQICGTTLLLNDEAYSEAHHLHPLGDPYRGHDVSDNLISVCPNCHVKLDYGAVRIDVTKLFHLEYHSPSEKYINYHNEVIFAKKGTI